MRLMVLIGLILFSFSLNAKKTPKCKGKKFKTTSSGLQYRIIKKGKGDPIRDTDFVVLQMSNYKSSDKSLIPGNSGAYDFRAFSMDDGMIFSGIVEAVSLLKDGGRAYFIVPPS